MTVTDPTTAEERTVDAHLDAAAAGLRRHLGHTTRTDAMGLRLGRSTEPTPLVDVRYPPSLVMPLSGRKRAVIGPEDAVWGRERFVVTPVDLPVFGGVVELGPQADFVSFTWRLDLTLVEELAALVPTRPDAGPPPRLGVVGVDLADTVARLFRLLDTPEDIPLYGPVLARELTLRLLQTDQAPRLVAAVQSSGAGLVTAAAQHLSDALDAPWTLDRLAATTSTSRATLVRRFRQLTGMSPLQYLRQLRLAEARRRMLVLGDTAARAATAVGYRSPSHFSRDYRTAFRVTPAAEIARWRTTDHADAAAGTGQRRATG